jgi:hypothetical protein
VRRISVVSIEIVLEKMIYDFQEHQLREPDKIRLGQIQKIKLGKLVRGRIYGMTPPPDKAPNSINNIPIEYVENQYLIELV